MKSISKLAQFILVPLAFVGCLNNSEEGANANSLATSAQVSTLCGYNISITPNVTNGLARDIGADGANGAWVVGTPANGNGYRLYQRSGTGWIDRGGGATRISAGGGSVWVVNSIGNVYTWNGSGWSHVAGAPPAGDIAVGLGGSVVITEKSTGGVDHGLVRRRNGSNWVTLGDFLAKSVTMDYNGNPWAVSGYGDVAYWDESTSKWVYVLGEYARDITWSQEYPGVMYTVSATQDGSSGNYYLMKWTGTCWARVVDGNGARISGVRIASATNSEVWYTKADYKIYKATL